MFQTLGLWKERRDADADSVSSQQSSTKGGGSRVSSVGSVSFRHVSQNFYSLLILKMFFFQKAIQLMVPPVIPEEASKQNVDEEKGDVIEEVGEEDTGDPNSPIRRIRRQYQKVKDRWKKIRIRRW